MTDYLDKSGLSDDLDALGFQTVGYGCTTCIGNSGPLPPAISEAINKHDLVATSVLSGNRNFEGRISPDVKANYLAPAPRWSSPTRSPAPRTSTSPPSRWATTRTATPSTSPTSGRTPSEIKSTIAAASSPDDYREQYAKATVGPEEWRSIQSPDDQIYAWDDASTYVQEPPFFVDMPETPADTAPIDGARVLVKVGDSASPPTTSPPPGRSSRPPPPGSTCRSTASRSGTSTPTAAGVGTTA